MTRKIFLNQVILVLISFVISQLVLAAVLLYQHSEYFNSFNWLRWDSGHYLQIAKTGYELFPCADKFGYQSNPGDMCGNTGWFPGYPYLIKLFNFIFNDTVLIAAVLSKIFYVLFLFMTVKILNITAFSFRNFLLVLIPAFSFGFIYYSSIFPISAVLFFVLSAMYFFIRRKIWMVGLFCFLASFFYPTGFLLAFVFAIVYLSEELRSHNKNAGKILTPILTGGLGVLFVFIIFQLTVHDWKAFIEVQDKYGHSFQSPVKNIGSFFRHSHLLEQYATNSFIYYQSFIVIVGYIVISFFFFRNRMFRNELYLVTYIYLSLFFIFPWSIAGDVSRYRTESLLLPFVFLLKETKTVFLTIILILLLIIGIPISYLFFTNVLV